LGFFVESPQFDEGMTMQGIQITIHDVGAKLDISLVTASGYIDTTTCQEMAKVIQDLMQRKKVQILVDLGRVTYISSAGWGVFVGEIKNVRERGGDLKFVQMVPEVFEVFEMLEFNKILNCYESVEEAIDEFDLLRGIDITHFDESQKSASATPFVFPVEKPSLPLHIQEKRSKLYADEDEVTYKNYPVVERIKKIVLEDPMSGIIEIRRKLNTDKYGNVKVRFFRLYSILRTLTLDTQEKRYRFYRSR
jgi:anti-sigma B factor antagonist